MRWLERVDDRVTGMIPRVDRVEPSPDGSLLAVWPRAMGERPHLAVIERESGREVAVIGPVDSPFDFAWVGDDALLVARDDLVEGSILSLHAIPDGGVAAERRFKGSRVPGRLVVSADRRRALAWMRVVGGPSEHPHVVVMDLPSLAPREVVTPLTFGDSTVTDVRLSDDGAWVLVARDWKRLSVLSVDRPEDEPVTFLAGGSARVHAAWVSLTRAVLCADDAAWRGEPPRLSVLDLSTWAITDLAWTQPHELRVPGLTIDPDRRQLANVLQPWTESRQRAPRLTVLDTTDWNLVARHPSESVLAFCWQRDGRALIAAEAVSGGLRVERWSPESGQREAVATVGFAGWHSAAELACVGDGHALIRVRYDDGDGGAAALIDLAP